MLPAAHQPGPKPPRPSRNPNPEAERPQIPKPPPRTNSGTVRPPGWQPTSAGTGIPSSAACRRQRNSIQSHQYPIQAKAETDFDEPICKQYLDKLELPRISQMDKESLEAPLSLEKLHVSLKKPSKGQIAGSRWSPPWIILRNLGSGRDTYA